MAAAEHALTCRLRRRGLNRLSVQRAEEPRRVWGHCTEANTHCCSQQLANLKKMLRTGANSKANNSSCFGLFKTILEVKICTGWLHLSGTFSSIFGSTASRAAAIRMNPRLNDETKLTPNFRSILLCSISCSVPCFFTSLFELEPILPPQSRAPSVGVSLSRRKKKCGMNPW